jgi:thiol-disulfide isomerase/thioredoxin
MTGWEGRALPDFNLATLSGKRVQKSDILGKSSLIYFWFTGCPPCVKIAPILAELSKEYQSEEFAFLGINADDLLEISTDDETRRQYLSQQGIEFVNLNLDSETRKAFGSINVFPTIFFVTPEGTIYKHLINFQSRETLLQIIDSMLEMN